MIRVLIADDSPVVRELLCQALRTDPGVRIAGMATNGMECVQLAKDIRPDLITMDVNMPKMNGLEAIRQIMSESPTPILVITSHAQGKELEVAFNALASGALSVIDKPENFLGDVGDHFTTNLLAQVHAFSRQRVTKIEPTAHAVPTSLTAVPNRHVGDSFDALGIGTSAGGPVALSKLFMLLPREIDVPILVVQHITPGFLTSFVRWLSKQVGREIIIAQDGQEVVHGEVYFAPEDHHLEISPVRRIRLNQDPPENGFRPSSDRLFRSMARSFGERAIGLILTGMGSDGARGLREIAVNGGVTMAQDESTSLVFGMAKQALHIGAVDRVLPIEDIAQQVSDLVCQGSVREEAGRL